MLIAQFLNFCFTLLRTEREQKEMKTDGDVEGLDVRGFFSLYFDFIWFR